MKKEFNVTGSCNPDRHYMVDTEKRFKAVEAMIDHGDYFTINRARQYGKTTMLQTIRRRLSDKYLIIKTSFEGIGDEPFKDEESFAKMFARQMAYELAYKKEDGKYINVWEEEGIVDLDTLAKAVTSFCQLFPKPVVVLIDEVDKSSNNQLFIGFIGMLRDLYLKRDDKGMDFTFHSVVLAGVYDIKNLEHYPEFREFMFQVAVNSEDYAYTLLNPMWPRPAFGVSGHTRHGRRLSRHLRLLEKQARR